MDHRQDLVAVDSHDYKETTTLPFIDAKNLTVTAT